jgi:hypothetical protein
MDLRNSLWPGFLRGPLRRDAERGTIDMPAYFARHVFVHTHIPKTGGSSFVMGLRKILGPEHVCDLRAQSPSPHEMSGEEVDRIWALSGHFWFDTQERPIRRRKHHFLSIRDPVDRFISLYNFVREAKGHPGHDKYGILDIEDAFDYLKQHMPNAISNTICSMFGPRSSKLLRRGEPGLVRRFDLKVTFEEALPKIERHYALVIPTKRVDDALRGIADAFGVGPLHVERHNVGARKVTELSDRVRSELLALNREDSRLLEHFEPLFDQRLRNLPARLLR